MESEDPGKVQGRGAGQQGSLREGEASNGWRPFTLLPQDHVSRRTGHSAHNHTLHCGWTGLLLWLRSPLSPAPHSPSPSARP